MYKIENILTKKECDTLKTAFYVEKKLNQNWDLNPDKTSSNTYGFQPSNLFNSYMNTLRPKINSYIKNDYKNVNTYIREYKNGSFLEKHTDRDDIGITLTICLENTTGQIWPIKAIYNNKEYEFNTEIGDGVLLIDSNKTIHWREKLECENDKSFIFLFIHWKAAGELDKKNKTLI